MGDAGARARGARLDPFRALRWSALFVSLTVVALPLGATDTELVRVAAALDGDSLRLADGREVRLIGINAPELGKDGKPDDPLARDARRRTSSLTRGQTVRLEYSSERFDRYGRTLAYVLLPDGRDVQEILTREGWAWYVAIPPNIARLERYRNAEAEARRLSRGLWSRPEYAPISANDLKPGRTGFVRLTGIVRAIRRRGDYVDLTLTPTVELRLTPETITALGRSPQSLIGRRVLARGWLTEYKERRRLRVTHPAMLEELS